MRDNISKEACEESRRTKKHKEKENKNDSSLSEVAQDTNNNADAEDFSLH